MRVTEQQKRQARKANLFDFLCTNHATAVELDRHGKTLRLIANHSISIKAGYSGYLDFATGEKGNGIDLLTRHFGYDFKTAVLALCGDTALNDFSFSPPSVKLSKVISITEMKKEIELPPMAKDYRRMMAYLTKSRNLPPPLVQMLIDKTLLYQADRTNNAVFVSQKRDFAELRGTLTDKPYHGIVKGSRHDGVWAFSLGSGADHCYICESAIDAISLAAILGVNAYYVSIAGAAKQAAIDRIKQSRLTIVIATDNDQAGDECRRRNSDCDTLRPEEKDWNEDLQSANANICKTM